MLFTTAALFPEAAPLRGAVDTLRDIILCESEAPGERTLAELTADRPQEFAEREMERDDPPIRSPGKEWSHAEGAEDAEEKKGSSSI